MRCLRVIEPVQSCPGRTPFCLSSRAFERTPAWLCNGSANEKFMEAALRLKVPATGRPAGVLGCLLEHLAGTSANTIKLPIGEHHC